jgi:hypothetical protein
MALSQDTYNYARGSDLPSAENNPIRIDYGNTYIYIKGKTVWNTLTMQFYSLATPNVNQKIWDYLNKHQNITEGKDDFKENYMGDVRITLLSPNEQRVGTWGLVNAFIQSVNMGTVSWSGEEVIQPEITFVYDYAVWRSQA